MYEKGLIIQRNIKFAEKEKCDIRNVYISQVELKEKHFMK